ncbi:MAG: Gfo/Idh/MocA family protein, partial [Rubripirellula sp.]
MRIKDRFPSVYPIENFDAMLDRDLVDAVVIATPTASHYELTMKALEHDLHVFVEKPLAKTTAECRELVDVAARRNRTLFVGHVFLHSSPVTKLREMIESDELGAIN